MADGTLKVGTITTSSGSGTITLGQSGETVDMANGSITLNSDMKNTPAFCATLSSDQSYTAGNFTKVQLDNEVLDTDNAFDPTTNYRFTVPSGKAGKYMILGTIGWNSSSNNMQNVQARIYKNGSAFVFAQDGVTTDYDHKFTNVYTIMDLVAGDYIELYSWISSGGGIVIDSDDGGTRRTQLMGYRIIGA